MADPEHQVHPRPGWIAFVQGECEEIDYRNHILNEPEILNIFRLVMYSFVPHGNEIAQNYHYGYNRFEDVVLRTIEQRRMHQHPNNNNHNPFYLRIQDENSKEGLRPYIKYYYNRQLIIQMTYIPTKYPGQEISIPIHRSPATEIQVDIMHFLPEQQIRQ